MLRKVCLLVVFVAVANAAPQLILDGGVSGLDEDAPFNDNPQYTYSYQVAADDEQTYIAHTESRDGADVSGEYSYVDPLGNLIKVTYSAGVMGYTETREVVPNFVQIRSRPVTPEPAPAPAPAPVRPVVQRVRPAVQQVQQVTTSSSSNDGDLVANIIAQLTPFIRTTVSNSLGSSSGSSSSSNSGASQTTTTTTSRRPVNVGTTRRVVSRQPVPEVRRIVESVPVVTETSSSSSAVSNIFGTGGPNNVRFESPDSSFAFDLN